MWPVVASPVFTDSSAVTKVVQLLGTVGIRIFVLGGPVVALLLIRSTRRWLPPVLVGLVLVANVALLAPLDAGYSWAALSRPEDDTMAQFTRSAEFTPGATYRVLRDSDGKVGMYQLIRAGGRLDSEFFPESMWYGDFAGARAYSAFLAGRDVDRVLVADRLAPTHATNEGVLLARMAGTPCRGGVVGVRLVAIHPGWRDYAIDRSCVARSGGHG